MKLPGRRPGILSGRRDVVTPLVIWTRSTFDHFPVHGIKVQHRIAYAVTIRARTRWKLIVAGPRRRWNAGSQVQRAFWSTSRTVGTAFALTRRRKLWTRRSSTRSDCERRREILAHVEDLLTRIVPCTTNVFGSDTFCASIYLRRMSQRRSADRLAWHGRHLPVDAGVVAVVPPVPGPSQEYVRSSPVSRIGGVGDPASRFILIAKPDGCPATTRCEY
jgi:hypothetical protein